MDWSKLRQVASHGHTFGRNLGYYCLSPNGFMIPKHFKILYATWCIHAVHFSNYQYINILKWRLWGQMVCRRLW